MRPTTPNYNFAQQAGPSSPPQTPTTASAFAFKNRRHGMHFVPSKIPDQNGTITPNGNGPHFFYTPSNKPAELSPRSSSPNSSSAHSDSSNSPPRSLSTSPVPPRSSSPPLKRTHTITAEATFILEEFGESDYEEWDSDDEDVIRPHQYEDAESERAASVRSRSPSRSRTRNDIDPHILSKLENLQCQAEEDEREKWLETQREEKRRKRRSSGSVQKRTISQSIGSDTDEEDLKPVTFEGANEIGSSARRLRRKTKGERVSLIFDDPPPRIDEEDEGPESVEEVLEIEDEDVIVGVVEDVDGEGGDLRELPYFHYVQDMDVDSDEVDSDEEEEEDEDAEDSDEDSDEE